MALIPPFFMDCVVAVGIPSPAGTQWGGTGFLFMLVTGQTETEVTGKTYLVTNKHVIEGRVAAMIRCNPVSGEPAREFGLDLLRPNVTALWTGHPTPDVDVAVVPIQYSALQEAGMQTSLFLSDSHILTRQQMRDKGVSEGDAAFILGFPIAMVGEHRNFVIVRGGRLARIRDCLDGINTEFLVDAFVFPGNSGGPVILPPEVVSIQGTSSLNAAFLAGIVKSYVPYQDVATSTQTGRPRVVFEENTGLAAAHTVDSILEAIKCAEEAQRNTMAPTVEEETDTIETTYRPDPQG